MATRGQVEVIKVTRQLLLLATMACHVCALTTVQPPDNYVLTMTVSYNNNKFLVNFPMDKFLDFYRCLCKMLTASCTAQVAANTVTHVEERYLDTLSVQSESFYNRYLCQHVAHDHTIKCSKFQQSQTNCSSTSNCYTYHFQGEDSGRCAFEPVGIVWILTQLMEGNYVLDYVEIRQCQAKCLVVNQRAIDSSDRTTLASTRVITNEATSTHKGTNRYPEPATDTPPQHPAPSTNFSNYNVDDLSQSHDDPNTKGITIGLVVSLVVVSLVLALLAVMLCRRRKTGFFAKSTKPDTSIARSVPTLTQLHYIDSTYANISPRPAAAMNKHGDTDPEIDDYFQDGSFDGTEYELDFSAYYTNNNLFMEASMVGKFPPGVGEYENYTRTETGDLDKIDTDGMKIISSDSCSDWKTAEIDDELVYEDLDCSAFEKVKSLSQGDGDIDNDHETEDRGNNRDINIYDNKTEPSCIQDSTILEAPINVETLPLTAQIYLSSDGSHEPHPQAGHLKHNLNLDEPLIKDSPNGMVGQALHNTQDPQSEARSCLHPAKDHVDVIGLSGSQNQPIKRINADLSPSKDRGFKDTLKDVLTARAEAMTISRKAHEYYELERASGHAEVTTIGSGMPGV